MQGRRATGPDGDVRRRRRGIEKKLATIYGPGSICLNRAQAGQEKVLLEELPGFRIPGPWVAKLRGIPKRGEEVIESILNRQNGAPG